MPLNFALYPQCTGATHTSSSKESLYDAGDTGFATPLAVCQSNYCRVEIPNGTYSLTNKTGETGCNFYSYEGYTCNAGFVFNKNSKICVAGSVGTEPGSCTTIECQTEVECDASGGHWNGLQCNSICPLGKEKTTRGCEVPNTACTNLQSIDDNLCVDHTYQVIAAGTQDICGPYESNIRLTEGTHLVTCDATFLGRLVLDAGVSLVVDDKWDIQASNISSNGTSIIGVAIRAYSGADTFSSFNVSGGGTPIDPVAGINNGNVLSYTHIYNVDTVNISGIDLRNSNIEADDSLKMSKVSSNSSIYSSERYVSFSGFSLGDQASNTEINMTGLALWSSGKEFNISSPYSSGPVRNKTMRKGNFDSYLAYGSLTDAYCYREAYVISNSITNGNSRINANCYSAGNDTNRAGSGIVPILLDHEELTVKVGDPFELGVWLFDVNGFVLDADIVWEAEYSREGVKYVLNQTWTGLNPIITIDAKEAYRLRIRSINGAISSGAVIYSDMSAIQVNVY